MKNKIKDVILGYLIIFLIAGIIVGNVFAIKYLGLWYILIGSLSIIILALLFAIGIALFEDLESEIEVNE